MHKTIEQLNTETVLNSSGKEKMYKTNLSDFDAWQEYTFLVEKIFGRV